MVMRGIVTTGLLCVLAACARAPAPPAGGLTIRCPEAPNCTESNGTGVYFAEDGDAGLGPMHLMITHFINATSKVSFQGRYLDGNRQWTFLSEVGNVYRADTDTQANLAVRSVSEAGTTPTWTLQAGNEPPFPVTGAGLRTLKLYINFGAVGFGQTQYILTFEGPVDRPDRTPRQATRYLMSWKPLSSVSPAAKYCTDATGAADPVVFQQGIDVEPRMGTVTANPSFVTMSCNQGAPATVYRWGYDYDTGNLFYFAAGIHMKRASYCGDAQYYTASGTEIEIADDHTTPADFRLDHLEASWTPTGASCAIPTHARHGDIVRRKGFTWACRGVALPVCQPPIGPAPYLIDAPEQPIP